MAPRRSKRLKEKNIEKEDIVVTRGQRPRRSKRLRRLPPTHVSQESDANLECTQNNEDDDAALQLLDHEGRVQFREDRRIRLMREEERQGIPEDERRRRFMQRRKEDMEELDDILNEENSDDEGKDDEEKEDEDANDNNTDNDEEGDELLDPAEQERSRKLRSKRKGGGVAKMRVRPGGKRGPNPIISRIRRRQTLRKSAGNDEKKTTPKRRASKRLRKMRPSQDSDDDDTEFEEKYSNDPEENKRRHELKAWLIKTVNGTKEQYRPTFLQLLDAANYGEPPGTDFKDGKGFYIPFPSSNGGKYFLKSMLPCSWRRNISIAHMVRDKERRQQPGAKLVAAQARSRYRESQDHPHNFYFASVVPNIQPLEQPLIKNFTNKKFKQMVYPGQWVSHEGGVSMRFSHMSNPSSKVFQAMTDPVNPGKCYEILTITCRSQYVREQGEAFVMAYADEWNKRRGQKDKFIITDTVGLNDEDGDFEGEARDLARKGIWIFQLLDEDAPAHPPAIASFADLRKLPYGVKLSGIQRRVVPKLGQGSNAWKK